ncbi:phospholipase D family protein [Bradyrhizobium liaoningense]
MHLLTTTASLDKTFKLLLTRHRKLTFGVARASHDFGVYKELVKHQRKIDRAIVGIHFYQTHPSFIEHFLNDKRVKFMKDSSELFHPKCYLFETSSKDWSCIIGSANFTAAAFSANTEACLVFEASDDASGVAKKGLDRMFSDYWQAGDYFESDDLEQYRGFWRLFRQRRKSMADDFDGKKRGKSPLSIPLLKMSWRKYYRQVLRDREHGVDRRISVLKEVGKLFESKGSLLHMSKLERQGIGGFAPENGIPWGWFGSMFGAGVFKKLMNANSPHLSKALDQIRVTGEVRRDAYMRFIELYVNAYVNGRHGLATATRLLAMKRPDYFVCVDAANTRELCKAFGVRLAGHDYERYWDSVVERILISQWWNSPRPATLRAAAIWDGRAAFLDSIFYKPKR